MQSMTLLAQYHVPGLAIEDRSIVVPLDWAKHTPGEAVSGETIKLFYRVVCAPGNERKNLPLLVFLQGGPGGACPRPLNATDDGWIAEAVKHFRVILPDQRGTGRSNRIDAQTMMHMRQAHDGNTVTATAKQVTYLRKFLADSIVRDFEHLRLTEFGGRKWTTLGQSYGGFLTLSYLSLFPEGIAAAFTTGGIPHIPADATEVYEHTFPRMIARSEEFYRRFPQDVERVSAIADHLATNPVMLPNGDPFTVERFQSLGVGLGMKPGYERLHWIIDEAFADGDGSVSKRSPLSQAFLMSAMNATSSHPLYWPLQEFIYADGELEKPIQWAGQRVRNRYPKFAQDARPLLFTGEVTFPWMFEQERALQPFKAAMDVMMELKYFAKIYDADQLARNDVPLNAAVYYNDLYVDSSLSLDTLDHIGHANAWVTNKYEHDGIHGDEVFPHLFHVALERGDLDEALRTS